jgi:carboxypeptidase PM20D1
MLKAILTATTVFVLAFAAVLGVRASALTHPELDPVVPVDFGVDTDRAVLNLAAAVRFLTLSDGEPFGPHASEFAALRDFLAAAYPRAHAALERELIDGETLLYRWAGTDPSLPPILLMGHMDVVPVEEGTEGAWTHDPFGGVVADGYVWGRGTLDNKQNVVGLLEATEHLLAEAYQPARTVYLLFGHDEEAGGAGGAAAAAKLLEARGVRFEFVVDEGGAILDATMLGTSAPVAIVRTAEKGYLTLELSVLGAGGHSSRPPPETPIGVLSRAIVALESNPFPARLEGAALEMLRTAAPDRGLLPRVVLANRWLLDRPLLRMLAADPFTNASIRTTIAPTMLRGSPKDNVLPSRATATVNFRILPGDSVAGVVDRVRRVIGDDRVELAVLEAIEPSPDSDTGAPAFGLLSRTIREIDPAVRVSPYLALGATDVRHFAGLSDNLYGFSPFSADADVLTRVHGTDERIAIADVERLIRFYVQLIRNATAG